MSMIYIDRKWERIIIDSYCVFSSHTLYNFLFFYILKTHNEYKIFFSFLSYTREKHDTCRLLKKNFSFFRNNFIFQHPINWNLFYWKFQFSICLWWNQCYIVWEAFVYIYQRTSVIDKINLQEHDWSRIQQHSTKLKKIFNRKFLVGIWISFHPLLSNYSKKKYESI